LGEGGKRALFFLSHLIQRYENDFTVRLVGLVQEKYPDLNVGEPDKVPKPYVAPSITSQHDLRAVRTKSRLP